jgi:hypothetical protein
MTEPRKPNNLKTALLLAAVALFFFVAVIAKHIWHF